MSMLPWVTVPSLFLCSTRVRGGGIIDLSFIRPDLAPTFLFFNTTFARLAGLLQLCFIVWPASRAPSAARYSVSESNQGGERATRETEMISLSPARLPTCPPACPALFLSFSPGWCCFCLVCLSVFLSSLSCFSLVYKGKPLCSFWSQPTSPFICSTWFGG